MENEWTKEIERLRAEKAELLEALKNLVDRVDRNGGIGEYKGGPAFVMGHSRATIAKAERKEP